MRRLPLLFAGVLAGCVSQAPTAENFHNVDHQFLMASAGHWKALASLNAYELVNGKFDLAEPGADTGDTYSQNPWQPDPNLPSAAMLSIPYPTAYPTNRATHRDLKPALCRNALIVDSVHKNLQPIVVFGKDPEPSDFSRAYRDLLASQLAAWSVNIAPLTAKANSTTAPPTVSDASSSAPTTNSAKGATEKPTKLTLDISVRVDPHTWPLAPPWTFTGIGTLFGLAALIAREPPAINPVQSLVVGATGGYFIDMTRQYFPEPTDAEVIVTDSVHDDQSVKCMASYVLYVPSRETDKYIGTPEPTPAAHTDICGEYYCESKTDYFEDPQKGETLTITLTSVTQGPSPVNLKVTGSGSTASDAVSSLVQSIKSVPDFHTHFVDLSVGTQPTALVVRTPLPQYLVTTVSAKSSGSPQIWKIATAPYWPYIVNDEENKQISKIASAVHAHGTTAVSVVGFVVPQASPYDRYYIDRYRVCTNRTNFVARAITRELQQIAAETLILKPEVKASPIVTVDVTPYCFQTVDDKDHDLVIVSESTGAQAATVSALAPHEQ